MEWTMSTCDQRVPLAMLPLLQRFVVPLQVLTSELRSSHSRESVNFRRWPSRLHRVIRGSPQETLQLRDCSLSILFFLMPMPMPCVHH